MKNQSFIHLDVFCETNMPDATENQRIHKTWARKSKRIFDILVAAVLLMMFLPIIGMICLLIRVTSAGPIFFAQERLGAYGEKFRVYKFRTMVVGAEALKHHLTALNEMDGPVFKMKKDPRITPFGRWLRRANLDEIPQLWNVLIGDMSMVGPRPLPTAEALQCDDWRQKRFTVKPGLTCLWQIGPRYQLSFDEWMRLDISYIERWSLWLDVKIVLLTVLEVFKLTGE